MPGFIQISDTHFVPLGALAYGRSDTAEALRRAVATINAKLPLLDGIDCVIVTGDLTDHGTPEEYAHFAATMADLDLPWQAVPGNHDRRQAMRAAFADLPWMPKSGPIQWLRDFPYPRLGFCWSSQLARNCCASVSSVSTTSKAQKPRSFGGQ